MVTTCASEGLDTRPKPLDDLVRQLGISRRTSRGDDSTSWTDTDGNSAESESSQLAAAPLRLSYAGARMPRTKEATLKPVAFSKLVCSPSQSTLALATYAEAGPKKSGWGRPKESSYFFVNKSKIALWSFHH